jgi:hypothetical protein
MKSLRQLLKKLKTEDLSQELLEYAIVAALLGLGVEVATRLALIGSRMPR